jgi:hypothetical protein
MAVDTLKLYERFSKAGMVAAAAKEVAEAIKESNDELALGLATKQDLDLKVEILRKEIADAKTSTIIWVAGMLLAQTGLIAALVKLL